MKSRAFASGLQLMFTNPEALVPFLIGSLAVAVLGNAAFQLLMNWFGTGDLAIIGIGGGALLILIGSVWIISRFVSRLSYSPSLVGKRSPEYHKGLILLVSSNEAACRKAIEWHQDALHYCWLLHSDQSLPAARKLQDELIHSKRKAELVLISDVFDPLEYRNKVEKIYSDLPNDCGESDVILDFTGMTACGSVGGVLACLNRNRAIQYTPGQYNRELKAMEPLPPIEVVLDWQLLQSKTSTDSV